MRATRIPGSPRTLEDVGSHLAFFLLRVFWVRVRQGTRKTTTFGHPVYFVTHPCFFSSNDAGKCCISAGFGLNDQGPACEHGAGRGGQLIKDGYGINVEQSAGVHAGFADQAYVQKGCKAGLGNRCS